MKSFKQHILEKLKVSVKNTTKHTLFPKTKDELKQMIKDEISKNGNECSLNHIDTSEIIDMSELFYKSDFNGDISDWNVSNVEDMGYMFGHSFYNGDISNWDVSKVKRFDAMFRNSAFSGDISKWQINPAAKRRMAGMFDNSPLENNTPDWYIK